MFHATQHDDRDRGGHRIPGLGQILLKVPVPPAAHQHHLVPDGGSPGLGHSVWLPPAGGPAAPAVNESELPVWALARIVAQFLPAGGELRICHGPGPGRTGLDVIPTDRAPKWMNAG